MKLIKINYKKYSSYLIISELKTLSTKRFSRKIGKIDQDQFNSIVEIIKKGLT